MKLTKPIQKVLALAGLAAALLLAAPPADAKRAKFYTNDQLTLLFSGSKVVATGSSCGAVGFDMGVDANLEFLFKPDGTFSVEHLCTAIQGGVVSGSGLGKWLIEEGELCLKFEDSAIAYRYLSNTEECSAVRFGKTGFGLYQGKSIFWNLFITHPKFSSNEKLLAALDKVASQAKAEAKAPANARVSESDRLKREAEIARLKQEAETGRLKREAEMARLRQETERIKQEAEAARLKREAELALLKRKAETSRQAPTVRDREADEQRLWASIKDTKKTAALKDYLESYPKGRFRGQAEARLKVLEKFAAIEGIDFGNYYALVIGINDYKHLPKLKTAVGDAKAVAKVLKDVYGFKVELLLNATHGDILDAFDEYREKLGSKDNMLLYYAGHGWLDEEAGRGYWLPVDAKSNRRRRWISNATLTDTLKTLQAKHVMVVADSCYSGTLTRSANVGIRSGDYYRRMSKKWARVALVSGGLEPVEDSVDGKHSPFANAFIDALQSNEAVMDGTALFAKVRRPVMISAQQTPEYSDVRNAGHDGGDFLFVRKQ